MRAKLGRWRRTGLLALAGAAIIAGALIAIATGPDSKARARRPAPRRALSAGARTGLARTQLALAAGYLGLSASALRRRLHSGSSLAQIAASTHGRSAHGLLEALVKTRVARIEAARARGALSAQRASRRIARVRTRTGEALARAGGG